MFISEGLYGYLVNPVSGPAETSKDQDHHSRWLKHLGLPLSFLRSSSIAAMLAARPPLESIYLGWAEPYERRTLDSREEIEATYRQMHWPDIVKALSIRKAALTWLKIDEYPVSDNIEVHEAVAPGKNAKDSDSGQRLRRYPICAICGLVIRQSTGSGPSAPANLAKSYHNRSSILCQKARLF